MFKNLTKLTSIVTICMLAMVTYIRSVDDAPSVYEVASTRLGITSSQASALLQIFTIAGYFKEDKAWQDIEKSGIFGNESKKIFKNEILPAILKSKALEANPYSLNIDILKHELFGKSKSYFWQNNVKPVNVTHVEDWILYLTQNGFARNLGQERNELSCENWMMQYKDQYLEAAKILGLIDRIDAKRPEYDECWIAGASRLGVLARLLDFRNTIQHGVVIKGETKILSGNRPIWAEMDGISDDAWVMLKKSIEDKMNIDDMNISISTIPDESSIAEGMKFIIELAKKYNIKLVEKDPTIKYSTKEECPQGLAPGRTYPNYADPNGAKLTETLMSEYLLEEIIGKDKLSIIDSKGENNERPNTASTIIDATEEFVAKIKDSTQKEYHILFVSNNPYIERQALAAQREVVKILKHALNRRVIVKIDAIGFGCKQDVATINSELGSLIAEKWRNDNQGRSNVNLMYQTRDNTLGY